jgi:biotin carboxylase
MTRDDITRMAREAGCVDPMVFLASYERFAALVAAAEREACAAVCDGLGDNEAGDSCEAMYRCAADIRERGWV